MKLQMLIPMSGPLFNLDTGDIADFDDEADAQRIVAAGFAVPYVEGKMERATKKVRKASEVRDDLLSAAEPAPAPEPAPEAASAPEPAPAAEPAPAPQPASEPASAPEPTPEGNGQA